MKELIFYIIEYTLPAKETFCIFTSRVYKLLPDILLLLIIYSWCIAWGYITSSSIDFCTTMSFEDDWEHHTARKLMVLVVCTTSMYLLIPQRYHKTY